MTKPPDQPVSRPLRSGDPNHFEEDRMSTVSPDRATDAETTSARWSWLYRVGGVAALITLVAIPVQAFVFIAWPWPSNALESFTLLQSNKLIGLLNLDLLYVVDNALLILVFIALYIALRRTSESFAAIATALGLAGVVALFASNTAFEMLYLSDGYAAATTEAERSMFLAAGQAMLATYSGTTYQVSYVLGSISGIILSAVMLRSSAFGKVTGYVGIFSFAFGLGLYVPEIGTYLALISVIPFLAIWYILVAIKLFRLGRTAEG